MLPPLLNRHPQVKSNKIFQSRSETKVQTAEIQVESKVLRAYTQSPNQLILLPLDLCDFKITFHIVCIQILTGSVKRLKK